jgi:hypothetical protein
MKQFTFLIIFIIATAACKEVFDIPPQSRIKATLLNAVTKKDTTSVITIKPISHDSLFYNKQSSGSFILPLSPGESTSFQITFDSVVDTVTFFHKTTTQYESMESGFYYEYRLKQINCTLHKIASIQITDSLINSTLHENIKVYIRPLSSGSN